MKAIIEHLEAAIAAHEKGLSLFHSNNYDEIPADKETEIMDCCSQCASHFKELREHLDPVYKNVYRVFYDGGTETNCRIGKNRWCFGLIEFARARLKDLKERFSNA